MNKIKRCNTCGRFLGEDSFYWSNKKKGYRQSYCKRCSSNIHYLWSLDNKQHLSEYNKGHYTQNKEHKANVHKQWYLKNKERIAKVSKQWHLKNKARNAENYKTWSVMNRSELYAKAAKRRALKLNATPGNANHDVINTIYKLSTILSRYLKQDYHVDHIIPLAHEGKHHEDNLQVITAKQNMNKSAKLNNTTRGIRHVDMLNHATLFNTILNATRVE